MGTGAKCSQTNVHLEDDDKCENGLNIPNSALQLCGESFVAADENHLKAS
ncbi:hypothetical protein BS47DRAFT_1291482 [Hydnum rufescens UP504]|uniref:Uncharacterized protein n=1 Tax=Hydnum rufescens UP504 TaxID=1448309 RepID=A0A9P6B489_9AGAM|nr:hypothetical protein BS47DRAFT_1291482 [Hydnum rufescens UP504]